MPRLCIWTSVILLLGTWPSAVAGGGMPVCVEPDPPYLFVDDCGGGIYVGIDPHRRHVFVCYANGECIVDVIVDTSGPGIPCAGRSRESHVDDVVQTLQDWLEQCGLSP